MLTIQPKILNNYRPAFKANEEYDETFDLYDMNEDEYMAARQDIEASQDNFKKLADEDLNLPKTVNKILKGGSIATAGILGGMAGGWGTGQTIKGVGKLAKKAPVKAFNRTIKNGFKFILDSAKKLGQKAIENKSFQKVLNTIKDGYSKFGQNKYGKHIVNFLNKAGKIAKSGYKKVIDGAKYVINKLKGVKSETYKKYAVNTVGVSSGIATGVNTAREKAEEN